VGGTLDNGGDAGIQWAAFLSLAVPRGVSCRAAA
jgi:hypothetical protein